MSKKTINCKTCNAEIAKSAKVCPACGAKNKKKFYKKPIFWIFIFIVLIAVISLSSGSSSVDIDYDNPSYSVSADEIISAYRSNGVTADETYKGKTIKVTGKIQNISEYTVVLEGDDEENWVYSVYCSVVSGQDNVIKSLSKGSTISITGVCDSTDLTGDIKLKNCKILTDNIDIITTASTESAASENNAPVEIDIDDLLEAYENNSVSADEKYKGKELKVKGIIGSVEDGYIRIEGTDSWEFTSVYAYYDSSEDVSALKKGQTITVLGTCKGEDLFSDIKLTNCTIK